MGRWNRDGEQLGLRSPRFQRLMQSSGIGQEKAYKNKSKLVWGREGKTF